MSKVRIGIAISLVLLFLFILVGCSAGVPVESQIVFAETVMASEENPPKVEAVAPIIATAEETIAETITESGIVRTNVVPEASKVSKIDINKLKYVVDSKTKEGSVTFSSTLTLDTPESITAFLTILRNAVISKEVVPTRVSDYVVMAIDGETSNSNTYDMWVDADKIVVTVGAGNFCVLSEADELVMRKLVGDTVAK